MSDIRSIRKRHAEESIDDHVDDLGYRWIMAVSDRHDLLARLDEAERENARLRAAAQTVVETDASYGASAAELRRVIRELRTHLDEAKRDLRIASAHRDWARAENVELRNRLDSLNPLDWSDPRLVEEVVQYLREG